MLLELLSPERITAFGMAFSGILTAWVGAQTLQVKKLRARVDELETQSTRDRKLLSSALGFVRELLWHIRVQDLLLRQHAPGVDAPEPPEIPDDLKEEV